MENKLDIFEPLFEKAENYAKTSIELYKLKIIDKSASILSSFISRAIAIILLLIFVITANIGLALWLGDLLGKSYYGFFCVAGFYGLLAVIFGFFLHKNIKKSIGSSIISQILN